MEWWQKKVQTREDAPEENIYSIFFLRSLSLTLSHFPLLVCECVKPEILAYAKSLRLKQMWIIFNYSMRRNHDARNTISIVYSYEIFFQSKTFSEHYFSTFFFFLRSLSDDMFVCQFLLFCDSFSRAFLCHHCMHLLAFLSVYRIYLYTHL